MRHIVIRIPVIYKLAFQVIATKWAELYFNFVTVIKTLAIVNINHSQMSAVYKNSII